MQRMIQPVRLAGTNGLPAWKPAMAQSVRVGPVSPPTALPDSKPAFIDSAVTGAVFSGLGTVASGIFTIAAMGQRSKMGYFFGALTAILAVKTFTELSKAK